MEKREIYLSYIHDGQYFTDASLANESIEELIDIFKKRRVNFGVTKDGYYVTRRAYNSGEIVDIVDERDVKLIKKTLADELEIADYDNESTVMIIYVNIDQTLKDGDKLWKPSVPRESLALLTPQIPYYFESDIGEEELEFIDSKIVVAYAEINNISEFNNALYTIDNGLTRQVSLIPDSGLGITTTVEINYLQVVTFYEGVIRRRNHGTHNDYVLGVDDEYEIIGGPGYGSGVGGGGAYINDTVNLELLQKSDRPLTNNKQLEKFRHKKFYHNVEFVKCNDIVNASRNAKGLEELPQHMTLVARAKEDIKKGEELFVNYGYAFWEDLRLESRRRFHNFLKEKYVFVIDGVLMDFLTHNFIDLVKVKDLELAWIELIGKPYANDLLKYIEDYHVRQSGTREFELSDVLNELWSKVEKPLQITINNKEIIQKLSASLQASKITDTAFVVAASKNKTSPTKKQKLSCLQCGYEDDVNLLRKEFNSLRIFCNHSCQRQYYKSAHVRHVPRSRNMVVTCVPHEGQNLTPSGKACSPK